MTRAAKLSIRYSISFKQKVVKEIEQEGVSVEVIRRRYGIKGGSTVQRWLKEFGKNHLLSKIVRIEMQGEQDRVKELEAEVNRLKVALADATMANDALGTLIEIVNKHVSIRPATSLPGFIRRIALFNKTNANGISKAGKDVCAR